MSFYDKLQLDPFVLKRMMHNSDSISERRKLFMIMLLRSILIVGFAIIFISTINLIFGEENSYLAVVLFCMLLSIRFVHFGYKITQSIVGLGIILLLIFLMPVIDQLNSLALRFILNLFFLGTILLLTSNKPQMGNPGLYSFAYVFLTGTNIPLSRGQWWARAGLLIISFLFFSILFIMKHKSKNLSKSFRELIMKDGLLNKKNLWLVYYALGIAFILQLGYLTSIKRYMWVGIAFSSLISIYELPSVKSRFVDRVIGVIVGTLSFFILAQFISTSMLSIMGGVALGLCTTYRFKNIYNCFGALALATTLFGTAPAAILRITNNLLGLFLGVIYLLTGQMVYRKLAKLKDKQLDTENADHTI